MTQMEQHLQPGEVVTDRTRPSPLALLARPIMLTVLFVAGVMFFTALLSLPGATGNGRTSAVLLMLFVIIGLAVFLARQARFLVYLATAHYVVTNYRVLGTWGLLRKTTLEVQLRGVTGAAIDQGVIERALRFGDLVLATKAGSERLVALQDPRSFHGAIVRQMEDSRHLRGTAAYPLHLVTPPSSPAPPRPTTGGPMPPGTPAQWAPDPFNPRQLRYWDGDRWTDHTAEA